MLGSGGLPESVTVAVFANAPEAVAVSTTVTVAVAPLAKEVGSVQVMGPVPVQVVPELGVTETKVIPEAKESERVTLFAAENPLLETVML